MSIESVARALHVNGLTPTQKLVLIGIANHDGDGGAWPSVATLAIYAGCSERHARRTTHELQAMGLIRIRLNQGGTSTTPSDRRPNRYDLLIGGTQHVPPLSTGGTPMSPRGGTPASERGDTTTRTGGTPMSGEPSCNHPGTPGGESDDESVSVDDLPEGPLKTRIKQRLEAGSGHQDV